MSSAGTAHDMLEGRDHEIARLDRVGGGLGGLVGRFLSLISKNSNRLDINYLPVSFFLFFTADLGVIFLATRRTHNRIGGRRSGQSESRTPPHIPESIAWL